MDEFTAKSALLTGMELIRRRPLLVLLWTAVLLVQAIVFAAASQEIRSAAQGAFLAGGSASSFNGQLLTLTWARLVVSLVVAALLWSSAFRAILRPAERRPMGFGPEELSIVVVWLITHVVAGIVSTGVQLLIIDRSVAMDFKPGVEVAVNAAAAISVLGLFWSAVASVWAFERRQIAPFRCWTIARGRFWRLAALLLGVAVLVWLAGAGLAAVFVRPAAGVQEVFRIPALLHEALSAAIGALEIAIVAGIVASAYRTSGPEPQAATFSSVVSGPAS